MYMTNNAYTANNLPDIKLDTQGYKNEDLFDQKDYQPMRFGLKFDPPMIGKAPSLSYIQS